MAEGLSRGEVIIVSAPGEYGKPRPSVIVQEDFSEPIESIIVCPMTSDLVVGGPVRPTVQPSSENGLRLVSQVMIDKIMAVHLSRCGRRIRTMSSLDMEVIDNSLSVVLGLAPSSARIG